MHERRKPGAEIIEREAHAQATQRVHGLAHHLVAAHHRRLGQLELKPAGIHTVLEDQATQRGQ
ncbi:hypothetical protein D3C77_757130 [compost metagenome]